MTQAKDIFELDADNIEFRNPQWNEQLVNLTDRVAKDLSCEKKIVAHLHKLYLFKTGSFIAKHVISDGDPNRFGSLIIQLPSIYAGGDLVVYDRVKSTKRIFDFGMQSNEAEFTIQYAAYKVDMENEVMRVSAGYRVLLVYSLKWQEEHVPKADEFNTTLSNELYSHMLRNTYSHLSKQSNVMSLLLENKYTSSSFRAQGVNALKGKFLVKINRQK